MSSLGGSVNRPRNVVAKEVAGGRCEAFQWLPLEADEDDFVDGFPGLGGSARPLPAGRKGSNGYGLDQIMNEAEAILAEAQAEADRIRNEAEYAREREVAQLREEAAAEARAELAQQQDPMAGTAVEELQAAARALSQAAQQVGAAWLEQQRQHEMELTEAAFMLARQVLGVELEARPELVVESVRDALGRLAPGESTVRLHPEDMPIVMRVLIELQTELNLSDVSFEEDPRVERGGCLVVSESGTVDTQPSSKLAQLRQAAEG